MNFHKILLLILIVFGALSSGLAFSHPVGGGPVGGGQIGGGGAGRNPNYPANVYPIVAPYVYPNAPGAYDPSSSPPIQGGSSVTNGNQTINANGTTCTVRPDGKKICN